MPPSSPASIDARLTSAIASGGSLPPSDSACSSSGMITSSTNRRARACRSSASGESSTGAGSSDLTSITRRDSNMRLTTRSMGPARPLRSGGRAVSTQGNSTIQLDLDPRDVALTQRPVERATMLPPAAFADPSRPRLGARPDLPRLGRRRPRLRRRRAGQVPRPPARHGQRRDHRRRGRHPARLPERMPPSRRPARRGGRGPGAQAAALPVPRLVVRPRRRAARGPAHGRGRGLRLLVQRPARRAPRGRRRAGADRPLRRGARPRPTTSAS